jgi:hypothetical protein
VKILGQGDLKKKLTVTAHSFSVSAREKIEQAGGKVTPLREPAEKKRRTRKTKPVAEEEEPETEATGAEEAPEDVSEATEEASSEDSGKTDSEES